MLPQQHSRVQCCRVGRSVEADAVWNHGNTRDACYKIGHVLDGQTIAQLSSYHLPNKALRTRSTGFAHVSAF